MTESNCSGLVLASVDYGVTKFHNGQYCTL